uniref:Uncharacterized protein n=1 Tax=Rhizophora mucronata TaxID=61149 RepID=A0A2P2JJF9_RHIMU
MSHEVAGTSKAAFNPNEFILTARGVAAERENVLDSVGLDRFKSFIDLADEHVSASEIHQCPHADDVLHLVGDIEGEIGGGASRSPGYVAECGVVDNHPLHLIEHVVHSVLRLRRKELEREHHIPWPAIWQRCRRRPRRRPTSVCVSS